MKVLTHNTGGAFEMHTMKVLFTKTREDAHSEGAVQPLDYACEMHTIKVLYTQTREDAHN